MQKIPLNRIRKIRTWIPGNEIAILKELDPKKQSINLIDLASNDYLALNRHPKLIKAAYETMNNEGLGAGGSRLITGTRPIHKKLEKALGEWLQREHVLLFPSGFQANLAAVLALANRHTPVIADRLIHHSLLLGVKASGAKLHRYSHNDLEDLEKYLKLFSERKSKLSPLVITESLFSMEGTSPNLKKVSELCKNYGAKLLVDEAHALGVLGEEGRGLCYGLSSSITMISGTFGKAFGSGGAFLACDQNLGEDLIQISGAFRYTTALAPPLCAASLAALQLIKSNPHWPLDLQKSSINWRQKLKQQGWTYPDGRGPIIPLLMGTDEKALKYQKLLEKQGILCVAIRPPTVPEGQSRLRLVVRRNLPKETLARLLKTLENS
tara:strand:- start:6302 stop:7444 length:1143 start_codon:yes stop_codon:yes gene_type:complete